MQNYFIPLITTFQHKSLKGGAKNKIIESKSKLNIIFYLSLVDMTGGIEDTYILRKQKKDVMLKL